MTVHRRHPIPRRRGIALIDAIIGALILGAGLAVVMSMSARALGDQARGEKMMVAAWLADELLTMVVVVGPDEYPQQFKVSGHFTEPQFDDFSYDVAIEEMGPDQPYRVTASVFWGNSSRERVDVESLIADQVRPEDQNVDDIERERLPQEPLDRYLRWHPEEDPENDAAASG